MILTIILESIESYTYMNIIKAWNKLESIQTFELFERALRTYIVNYLPDTGNHLILIT